MLKYGVVGTKFKGFMVDIAQANWNVVRIVYGFVDPTMEMVNKEKSCLFHWI
jgi:hypothetical protein